MIEQPNCQQISSAISTIKSKAAEFDVVRSESNVKDAVDLMNEIRILIKEAKESIWSFEILTVENIEKQYDEWSEMYRNLDPKYELPSKERLLEFLRSDPEFIELMKTKEKQGLTKLIIAPAPGFDSLKNLVEQIGRKTRECGGDAEDINTLTGFWKKAMSSEGGLRYFGYIHNADSTPSGGITAEGIKSHPDEFSVCDGWMISFATDEQSLTNKDEPDLDTGSGRMAIKTGKTAEEYMKEYFSGENENYKGEEPMIPQEYCAVYFKYLYEKYVKTGIKIEEGNNANALDNSSLTWFISTSCIGERRLPHARLYGDTQKFYLYDYPSDKSHPDLGVRAVVRRKLIKTDNE